MLEQLWDVRALYGIQVILQDQCSRSGFGPNVSRFWGRVVGSVWEGGR